MTPIPDSAAAAGSTNTPNSDRSATEGTEGLRNDLSPDPIRKLARVLDPVAYDPRAELVNIGQNWDQKRRQMVAEVHATAAHAAGYRLLVEDDVRLSEKGSDQWLRRSRHTGTWTGSSGPWPRAGGAMSVSAT